MTFSYLPTGARSWRKRRIRRIEPYFVGGDATKPRSTTVHVPHVRLVQSVLKDDVFFRGLEQNMGRLAAKPAYFMFGDAVAFGPLKCDVGPRTRIDLSSPEAIHLGAKQLSGTRALCPSGLACADDPAKPFQSKCVDANGKDRWYLLESFLRVWDPSKVAGVFQDVAAPEYLALKSPGAVLEAIEAVHAWP